MKLFFRSSWVFLFLFVSIVVIFFYSGLQNQNRIKIDASSYYMYLPSIFIKQDIKLNYIDKNPLFYREITWYNKLPNGKKIIKHPMGISLMLLPFFCIGHIAAIITSSSQDGYSLPYQNAMSFGVLFYLLIGLYFLKKTILFHFEEKAANITIISIVLGTNLFWYSTFEAFMSHSISFSLLCCANYFFTKWLKDSAKKDLFIFSSCFSLLIICRPLLLILVIYFITFLVLNKGGIKHALFFLNKHRNNLIYCTILSCLIVSPQLFYYKYISGQWIINTYINEHFFFNRAEWISFLFSYRKGWFVYTPLMILSLTGLVILYKTQIAIFYSTIFLLIIAIFILSSWWCWSYAACFGMRIMIDFYGLLSIPLAALFSLLLNKNNICKLITYIATMLLIAFNLFQTWQYKNGLIHFDFMTKESYLEGIFQTRASIKWYDLLKPYDYDRRNLGLDQEEYSQLFFKNIAPGDLIYFRSSYNLQFLSSNDKYHALCTNNNLEQPELFQITKLKNDTIALKPLGGKFITLTEAKKSLLIAEGVKISQFEKFELQVIKYNDNKIMLKAANGNYLTVDEKYKNLVVAESNTNNIRSTFRLYKMQKQN